MILVPHVGHFGLEFFNFGLHLTLKEFLFTKEERVLGLDVHQLLFVVISGGHFIHQSFGFLQQLLYER